MARIAINGFGRIGRMIFRSYIENFEKGLYKNLEIVAINDVSDKETLLHLLQYDSVHGRFNCDIQSGNDHFVINGHNIKFYQESDPQKLPWGRDNIDLVYECSGKFTSKSEAMVHLNVGAKKVLISAPSVDADKTLVFGVNHHELTNNHTIVSNGSCTTNCLAPVVSVLHKAFEIVSGYMTTVHAYTQDQRLHDAIHSDLRRARAAAVSMIPTTTGAAKSIGKVIPELNGKLDGTSIRVPVANVSLIDLSLVTKQNVSVNAVNRVMKTASESELKDILAYTDKPLVSADFNHDPHSAIFDSLETQTIGTNFCRILAWYDNEWAFSNRMNDIAAYWMR